MPFKPGNPGGPGRPTNNQLRRVQELARKFRAEAIDTIAEIMRDAGSPPAVRLAAACALLDRDVGKPQQMVDATVTHATYADLVAGAAALPPPSADVVPSSLVPASARVVTSADVGRSQAPDRDVEG